MTQVSSPTLKILIGLRGGAVSDISGVEQIIVYDHGRDVDDAPVLKGNILQGSSIERPDLFIEGPLKIVNDATTAQTLDVDIQQSGNGRLIISLPENAETSAPVVVTGQVDFGSSPAIQVVPTGETFVRYRIATAMASAILMAEATPFPAMS
ncbi:hypothetical protein [Endozoicomonas sp. ALC020]|uniref:hypothetical protein n=1 Tax=unclassified Endozoicomonas TaxID=2644528 RepID=UPI003BAE2906